MNDRFSKMATKNDANFSRSRHILCRLIHHLQSRNSWLVAEIVRLRDALARAEAKNQNHVSPAVPARNRT
jgi:hypothetical protein